jgi:uncharacterized protein with ParB-like and HNH nuclease domain
MASILSIGEYFSKKQFVVPNYQRGYKWGVPKPRCAVNKLMDDLIAAKNENEYFVQGVTVYEENEEVYLIDGQQRTTTFFLLLYVLGRKDLLFNGNTSKLKYAVRADSYLYLLNLLNGLETEEHDADDPQDIFYFKKAIKTIRTHLEKIDVTEFAKFILNNVKLFYIIINKEQATKTFLMLNGNKAKMKEEELIKSAILSRASRNDKNEVDKEKKTNEILTTKDWEINALRNKYAREWDKWLYWWEKSSVSDYFGTNKSTMGLLLEYFYYSELKKKKSETKNNEKFNFENFNKAFLSGNQLAKISSNQSAKITFKGIRDLQKTFEDIFNSTVLYNLLGLALTSGDKFDVIQFFINNKSNLEELKRYVKWVLVGCTDSEISKRNEDKFKEKANEVLGKLQDKFVYQDELGTEGNGKKDAYKQLLRLNVFQLLDSHKFDFKLFKEKSLEHICPQNPKEDDSETLNSQKDINDKSKGIHSIGNLVLLDGSLNSALSNHSFKEKRGRLFKKIKEGKLLLHTFLVFAKTSNLSIKLEENEENKINALFDNTIWSYQDVINNETAFFAEFGDYYNIIIP